MVDIDNKTIVERIRSRVKADDMQTRVETLARQNAELLAMVASMERELTLHRDRVLLGYSVRSVAMSKAWETRRRRQEQARREQAELDIANAMQITDNEIDVIREKMTDGVGL